MNTTHPNVLLITVDHWFADLLGSAGHPTVKTPTLDVLAASGTRYARTYSETPVCVPARRALMTGTTAQTHGDRTFQQDLPMPDVPTVAQTFRDAGYQTYAVGKLHVSPQRARIGFDDVLLSEEGRSQWGVSDDYERELARRGFAGQAFTHGMSNNQYTVRPWHLPEELHVTRWAAEAMSETILRRDPTRPAFWYLSFVAPHPPIVPPADYLAMYDDVEDVRPVRGDWCEDEPIPQLARRRRNTPIGFRPDDEATARRGFLAQCTYVDHQLRVVIGTLREAGLLDDTVIVFTADHGDLLGDHGLWAKRVFYERSTNVPLIISPAAGDERIGRGIVSDRLTGLADVMPTLLDLARVPVPDTVEGRSVLTEPDGCLYGEFGEGTEATRMVHDGRWKLVYYPAGNIMQLFDTETDRRDEHDLSRDPAHEETLRRLLDELQSRAYGDDVSWYGKDGPVGFPADATKPWPDRGLLEQRGLHLV